MSNTPANGGQNVGAALLNAAKWPPLVYVILGGLLFLVWLGGTAAQIQTSEAWIAHQDVKLLPTLAVYGQMWDFIHGQLPDTLVVPFIFAYGVQIALIATSIGVELPRHPAWRWWLALIASLALIVANSCGDFNYARAYGGWGQLGFTAAVLFITFVVGLLAIVCFIHAFKKAFA